MDKFLKREYRRSDWTKRQSNKKKYENIEQKGHQLWKLHIPSIMICKLNNVHINKAKKSRVFLSLLFLFASLRCWKSWKMFFPYFLWILLSIGKQYTVVVVFFFTFFSFSILRFQLTKDVIIHNKYDGTPIKWEAELNEKHCNPENISKLENN